MGLTVKEITLSYEMFQSSVVRVDNKIYIYKIDTSLFESIYNSQEFLFINRVVELYRSKLI